MDKCFAYYEKEINGFKMCGCDALNREAFWEVNSKVGGCCAKNCNFYKASRDQIRTDNGVRQLTYKQKYIREKLSRKV